MEKKVHEELADPARKNDPLVKVDVRMLDVLKRFTKKSEMLILVGAMTMKKAKTQEEKDAIKAKIRGALHTLMTAFKKDMAGVQLEAKTIIAQQMLADEKAKKTKPKDDASDYPSMPEPEEAA